MRSCGPARPPTTRCGGRRSPASKTSARLRSSCARARRTWRRRSPSPAGQGCRWRFAAAGTASPGARSTEGMLIDAAPMDSTGRLEGELATIGAGARLGAVYDALGGARPHDRRPAAGRPSGSPGSRSAAGSGSSAAQHGLTCGQPARGRGRARRRAGRRRASSSGAVLGAARRRRRALRRGHRARVRDRAGAGRDRVRPGLRRTARAASPRRLAGAGRPTRPTRSPRACCSTAAADALR